jgi:hypothetical protein
MQRRKRHAECVGRDHHLVNVIALSTLKGVEVETQACGHDASEHRVSTAPWTNWTMDDRVDVVGQGIGFLHVLPSKRRERNTLCHRSCLVKQRDDETTLSFKVSARCSILNSLGSAFSFAKRDLSALGRSFRQIDRSSQCPSSSEGCRHGYDVVSRTFVSLIRIVCGRRRTNGAHWRHDSEASRAADW